ncbi:MAG TPA: putative sugar nucleotidyl transferase [Chitinophagales bacterium]|nr:putative sugar nucleotidyl transferase [Chitinophagales bacterium]
MPIQHIVLFDGNERDNLLPLTATRAVADLRIGILTIKEKWEKYFQTSVKVLTQDYLQEKYPYTLKENSVFINASILPSNDLLSAIEKLENNIVLKSDTTILALKTNDVISSLNDFKQISAKLNSTVQPFNNSIINFPWNIFSLNGQEIKNDIQLLGLKPNPEKLSLTNTLLGSAIYVEDGVDCECSVLNSKQGPIYLGKNSEVMEGCTIRGPFALGDYAALKMQTKIYGDTTIGPYCKIGGEVSNSVFFGYSNKAHDGFLGNSVIGEWCNLGADTNNSNLKNNYGKVKVYNYPSKDFIDTGLQFCGLIMGDHAKSSINTMFNTGTVAGVCANVFGGGFHPKYIPDFAWGNEAVFELEKAYEVAQRVIERRSMQLKETDKKILKHIFDNR